MLPTYLSQNVDQYDNEQCGDVASGSQVFHVQFDPDGSLSATLLGYRLHVLCLLRQHRENSLFTHSFFIYFFF